MPAAAVEFPALFRPAAQVVQAVLAVVVTA
jgi:hypothetical protein